MSTNKKQNLEEQSLQIIRTCGTCPSVGCDDCVFAFINKTVKGCNSETAVKAAEEYLRQIGKLDEEYNC